MEELLEMEHSWYKKAEERKTEIKNGGYTYK